MSYTLHHSDTGAEVNEGDIVRGTVTGYGWTFLRIHTMPTDASGTGAMLSVRDANGRKATIAAPSFEVTWQEDDTAPVADGSTYFTTITDTEAESMRYMIGAHEGFTTARAILGNGELLRIVQFACEVAADCDWNEGSFDVALHELSASDVVRNMARHYDGGMAALVADALADTAPVSVRVVSPDKVEPVVGERVANGSLVIACKRVVGGHVVLCLTGSGHDPYATWRAYDDGHGAVACVHGHYFTSITEAACDYADRA